MIRKFYKSIFNVVGALLIISHLLFINTAKAYTPISPQDVMDHINASSLMLVIDLRTRQEFDGGHLPTSINIPINKLSSEMKSKNITYPTRIIVYSDTDKASDKGAKLLESLGYTDVWSMGSLNRWTYRLTK
ncbi:rhodanese-like domain-containing protein [Clostridium bovifaecis]|uniref:Rhodanese-like domain-containing protein n=1 Tax=Clostridium bovifaecis TaxID=2184719 RepID=A0A6I6FDX9_9CLOT|nr:rhodanese-like domain-containing protein [Clostridium bovifaecis]